MNNPTKEDKEILKNFKKGKLRSIKDAANETRRYQRYANNTLLKNK